MKNTSEFLEKFTQEMHTLYKEKLTSVIIYGSCAKNLCQNKFSDINSIVVIDKLNAHDLKLANKVISKWIKSKNPLPIFMDKEEWFNSTDVYPIEYSDIKERYKIIYGEDIVSKLELSDENLRLMCEHEIKNILIKLRQYYLANSSNLKSVESLILAATKGLIAVFKAVLRLQRSQVPQSSKDVINQLSETITIDKDIFFKILELKNNKKVFKKEEYEIVIQKLIDTTDTILKAVDKL